MKQYNYPTIIYCGEGALERLALELKRKGHKKPLLVTDPGIWDLGLMDRVLEALKSSELEFVPFHDIHPNPQEEDVDRGTEYYKSNNCDAIVALGGGSPMDVAKTLKITVTHPGPLMQYDDAAGGDEKIIHPMPPMYAIPTTAGTGSEVGRSSVIIMQKSGRKTIFFHPDLMPDIAVLEPSLTVGLPAGLTAATGMDALTHNLEAYFAPVDHPMADGIALEGLRLVLEYLPPAVADGTDLVAREKMMLAATMGATAFQKGLGMTHSMAHPLSEKYGMHHGLANALLVPHVVEFLEEAGLDESQQKKLKDVNNLFSGKGKLSENLKSFTHSLGINNGLKNNGVGEADLEELAGMAVEDPCHATNLIPVEREDFLQVFQRAY